MKLEEKELRELIKKQNNELAEGLEIAFSYKEALLNNEDISEEEINGNIEQIMQSSTILNNIFESNIGVTPEDKEILSLGINMMKQAEEFAEEIADLFSNRKKAKDQEMLNSIENYFDDKHKTIEENKAKDQGKLYVVTCDEYEETIDRQVLDLRVLSILENRTDDQSAEYLRRYKSTSQRMEIKTIKEILRQGGYELEEIISN